MMAASLQVADGGPVVAVLPFAFAAGDRDDALIGRGLQEDVTAELTRFRTLRVISPHSAAAVAALPEPQIAAKLGASHLVRGRVVSAGGRLRVSASLGNADGTQLWSERIEMATAELFALQDDLVARLASALNVQLEASTLALARRRPLESLQAYALTVRGMSLVREGTYEADAAARELFERALALDPNYARAHAGISLSWFNEYSCQYWAFMRDNGQRAYAAAHRALELDDRDGMVHFVIGRVLLFQRDFERAAWYQDRALALSPNDADLLIHAASGEGFLGRAEHGVALAERARLLNPLPPPFYDAHTAFAYLMAGDVDTAYAMSERCADVPWVDAPAFCANAAAWLGRIDEGRSHLDAFRRAFRERIVTDREPADGEALAWFFEINPFRSAADVARLEEGFRRLGETWTRPEPASQPSLAEPPGPDDAALSRVGEGWIADFAGQRVILPDLKGLADLHKLLARPGSELHCLDLAEREDAFGGDTVLDDRARQALTTRIRDLQEDLAEAEDRADLGRAERLREEMDALVEALSAALGLGSRSRRMGDAAEKARTAVTWRLRHALRKVEAVHPDLGRHLAKSVRTGTFCAYAPEEAVRWRLGVPARDRSGGVQDLAVAHDQG